jgi:hypothetical protein
MDGILSNQTLWFFSCGKAPKKSIVYEDAYNITNNDCASKITCTVSSLVYA